MTNRKWRGSVIVTYDTTRSKMVAHCDIRRPTYAEAILDRLVHNAHRIELTGESLRRARGKQAKTA